MPIRPEEVAKVAELARLRLEEDALEGFAAQMDGILAYMETLGAVDTAGVEPLYSPVMHATPLREDTARKTYPRDRILANAPATDGQFFIVPKIV
ncbi:MAG: Asp-tRNA(Asn)/Glu-tRNA(Gln) amidotransferase subunit GatC [Solidesulfovibrio sp.]|uniref:Asp-tRNA(Asn)/Glu-tRNA(Gln) amidotransferase subunit GatC n=1 Tax=Solidesulfovibrio sp. TaxID=2910990 RepID=UPI002B1FACE2|nr:Asp-tRNA(Asn)/Glu-tRNA(Gln) amidotransferase subunit GatC [Solidesulfovibrio sp.]MEA4857983.1 Asp-tRNA(Asn)/Glu-tRNA(Gln) amidotransferase subunit GatC [Solidesulfovibrio sp.]